jgi:hypothetical protein
MGLRSVGFNSTMRDRADRFRGLALDCEDRAAWARNPIDRDAWLKLAEDWLALATATEAVEGVQNLTAAVNGRPA